MGSGVHQTLKSLCFNTEWSYCVFWKLKHRTRMVLAWEDAYYNSGGENNPSDKCFSKARDSLHDVNYSLDILGLAVAMMSSHVYSLGEGIVGHVAATGKHKWIVADGDSNSSCSLFEHGDGWQNQFAAGIRTIAVVSVIPHGVLQFGSLNEVRYLLDNRFIVSFFTMIFFISVVYVTPTFATVVVEDIKLVTHFRNLFFALQGSSMVSNMLEYDSETSLCLPNLPTKNLTSLVTPDSFCDLDKAATVEGGNIWFPHFPHVTEQNEASFVSPRPSICHTNAVVKVSNKHIGPEISMSGGDVITTFLNSKLNTIKLDSQVGKESLNVSNYEGETRGSKETSMHSENMLSHSINCVTDSSNAHCQIFPVEKLDCADLHKNAVVHSDDSSVMKVEEDLQKRDFQTESSQLDTFLTFTAGCELYEALGPAFQKKNVDFVWEGGKCETGTNVEIPREMSSSKSRIDSGSEHLLEAVVANLCQNGSEVKSEKSFSVSVQSMLTAENILEPSSDTKRSSFVGLPNCLNSSELSGVMSSKGFSCPSACSEPLERSSGPGKNKKRARSGESCRPRPRDRQLIQDRIKELRELVPSGSKCSIDSLLERTIKHTLFLQSITKHADKLNKCSDLKSHSKEMGMQGSSSCEQGSSWAVEVGSHLKVCSILVENLNKDGQMLVEMLCEECSHFLEIAEAIRSLGLTILKGVTETRSEKTWICFVVEGKNNRSIHRMDILWSLVQILQPNATLTV